MLRINFFALLVSLLASSFATAVERPDRKFIVDRSYLVLPIENHARETMVQASVAGVASVAGEPVRQYRLTN